MKRNEKNYPDTDPSGHTKIILSYGHRFSIKVFLKYFQEEVAPISSEVDIFESMNGFMGKYGVAVNKINDNSLIVTHINVYVIENISAGEIWRPGNAPLHPSQKDYFALLRAINDLPMDITQMNNHQVEKFNRLIEREHYGLKPEKIVAITNYKIYGHVMT